MASVLNSGTLSAIQVGFSSLLDTMTNLIVTAIPWVIAVAVIFFFAVAGIRDYLKMIMRG